MENNGIKKHQWTVAFTYQKNGITVSENYTERNDDWEELVKYKKAILNHLPSAKSFPEDEGDNAHVQEVDQTPDFCRVHKVKMKERRNDTGTWFSHGVKQDDGTYKWCVGKGFK